MTLPTFCFLSFTTGSTVFKRNWKLEVLHTLLQIKTVCWGKETICFTPCFCSPPKFLSLESGVGLGDIVHFSLDGVIALVVQCSVNRKQ